MPNSAFVKIPEEEQAQMLAALRRARYGSLLALHILLLSAAGRTPTDIAAVLFCSRSSVYRTVRASREGSRRWRSNGDGQLLPPVCRTALLPMLRRSLLALRKAMVFADELDIHLSPKVGYAWMPKGTQMTGMTQGTNEQHDLARAVDLAIGALLYGVAARNTNALFRELLTRLDACYPAERYTRL
jgi:Homeodomain-like domain